MPDYERYFIEENPEGPSGILSGANITFPAARVRPILIRSEPDPVSPGVGPEVRSNPTRRGGGGG